MKQIIISMLLALAPLCAGLAGDDALVETKHSFLGVRLGELSPAERETNKLGGVRVDQVVAGSSAEKFGINSGDVIISIDGHLLNTPQELVSLLAEYRPEERITVKINRDGETREIPVELGEKIKRRLQHRKWVEFMDEDRAWIGIRMNELNPQMAESFKVDGGVMVEWVEENSPAAVAGLKAGDIILKWEGTTVSGTDDIFASLDKAQSGDAVLLTVNRAGENLELPVGLGAAKDNPNWKQRHNYNFDFKFDPNMNTVIRERLHDNSEHMDEDVIREHVEKALEKQIQHLEQQLENLRRKLDENQK